MAAAAKFSLAMILLVALAIISNNRPVAADPDLIQDVCVADLNSGTKINGYPCKANFDTNDFFFDGLTKPGLTNNTVGSKVTPANVEQIPGLNTLGVSLSRIDYAPGGVNPPHTHPRASEVLFVLEGEVEVGFITTAGALVTRTVKKGEVFMFPRALVHFQKNAGKAPAAVLTAFNSQFPGTQSLATTLFTSEPAVPDAVLAAAFQIDAKEVDQIRSKLAPKK